IVRGDAMGQGPEALEEVALGMAEGLAVGPGLGPPEDGAEGKDEEVGQGGELGAVDARVGQVGEVVQQSQLGRGHGGSSGCPVWSRTLTEVRPQYLTSRKSLAFKGLRCADPGADPGQGPPLHRPRADQAPRRTATPGGPQCRLDT